MNEYKEKILEKIKALIESNSDLTEEEKSFISYQTCKMFADNYSEVISVNKSKDSSPFESEQEHSFKATEAELEDAELEYENVLLDVVEYRKHYMGIAKNIGSALRYQRNAVECKVVRASQNVCLECVATELYLEDCGVDGILSKANQNINCISKMIDCLLIDCNNNIEALNCYS